MALNPLQERIALLAADLASAQGFARVGGAALNILDVVDRRTQDLDNFHPLHDSAVARYGNALEELLREAGLDVAAIRRTDTFAGTTSPTAGGQPTSISPRPPVVSRGHPLRPGTGPA